MWQSDLSPLLPLGCDFIIVRSDQERLLSPLKNSLQSTSVKSNHVDTGIWNLMSMFCDGTMYFSPSRGYYDV